MQRKTQQRTTIQDVLRDAARPLTVHEILERAGKRVPSLGIATVYRGVKTLLEAGDLVTVDIAGEPTRYEAAHLDHHHHFVCRVCKKVFDLEGCVPVAPLVPKGFKLEEHEIVLHGVCTGCG